MHIKSGPNEQRVYDVLLGTTNNPLDLKYMIYGEHLVTLLDLLAWDEDDPVANMHFGAKAPMVIQQGKNYWALAPSKVE